MFRGLRPSHVPRAVRLQPPPGPRASAPLGPEQPPGSDGLPATRLLAAAQPSASAEQHVRLLPAAADARLVVRRSARGRRRRVPPYVPEPGDRRVGGPLPLWRPPLGPAPIRPGRSRTGG